MFTGRLHRRSLVVLAVAGASILTAALMAQPQASPRRGAATWTAPRTPWGDPDLQGIYTNKDENNTPFERPPELAGTRLSDFGEKEMVALRKQRQDAAARQARSIGGTAEEDTGAGPAHWYEHLDAENAQPWLVIEPEDGRVPPLTAAARERAAARQAARRGRGPADSYTDRSIYDRCISRGVPDTMRPIIYGASYDITQAPGYVVIRYEMIHEARVIPLDGRAPVHEAVRQHSGLARGHWEGDTLVVETANFNGTIGVTGNGRLRPTSDALKMVERFTRTGPTTLQYRATVDDPRTWTGPWTVSFPLERDDAYGFYEYACHEGNNAMRNILSGARADERTQSR